MTEQNSPLENLHIASPCHASWDAMTGDDKARFCNTCQKNVFNISMMTRAEAEKLISQREGNLCVRYAQREDGTILTEDCPVGVEKAKFAVLRPWRFFVAGVAGIVAAACSVFGVTPTFAQPPINPPKRAHEVKGDVGPKVETPVRMGEAVACQRPAPPKVITMGKPATTSPTVTIMQGAPPPPPQPTPAPVIMGKMVAPQTKPPVKPQVTAPIKPIVKKSPVKKTAKKR